MESDYTLLYLHHGLTSDNKPSLSWLRDAYREFDRKWVGACAQAPGVGPGGPMAWGQVALEPAALLIPWHEEAGAPTWVNIRNLKSEEPGRKSQFLCFFALGPFISLNLLFPNL